MIAFRDILIFAGLVALAAAVITSLFPVREGASPVPACSDCEFKLTGGYWVLQHGSHASLYLGTREVARYGWAYVDGKPLGVGETVGCNPMYVYVLDGIAYVSCRDGGSALGRRVLSSVEGVTITSNSQGPGCSYTVNVELNVSTTAKVEVYDENGKLIYSTSNTPPAKFTFSIPKAGKYRMHIYAPPLLDDWYMLYAGVEVTGTKTAVFYTNENTQDLRSTISLKVFDVTNYWKQGYTSVTVYVSPARDDFTLSAPSDAFADYLLAWEDCLSCDNPSYRGIVYVDEVWRLTFTSSGPVLTRIYSHGGYWHRVYADGNLVYVWNGGGPKNDRYVGTNPSISVKFVSPDSTMNAEATFTKVCRWS